MSETQSAHTVNIRPGVSVLSLFRHLNYKPWYAMAEFVDNSIQSFVANRRRLQKVEGARFKLKVEIQIDPDGSRIVVRDNAAGIALVDYERAFKPAEPPPDKSGLAEFGVGMKSAACWFAREWEVRTKALGEDEERTIQFDVARIVRTGSETIAPTSRPAPQSHHYTEIVLGLLHKPMRGRTLSKVSTHLASIYRVFLREGNVQIRFNGNPLSYDEPEILEAPFYRDEGDKPKKWRKEIGFSLPGGIRVEGFAAIRKKASVAAAGFALFRRGRLIEGSGDEGYRPEVIFGQSNSFSYQRLFGEFAIQGAQVSHTKDGFQWEEYEDAFLEKLRSLLDAPPLRLLQQAEGHRVRPPKPELGKHAEQALRSTRAVLERDAPGVIAPALASHPYESSLPRLLPKAKPAAMEPIELVFQDNYWHVRAELTDDPSVGDWLAIAEKETTKVGRGRVRNLEIRLSLAHPFMVRFADMSTSQMEPVLRVAMALALAEITARESGVKYAGTIRNLVNDLLRDALSKP
jgi:histidine kinase/DNA gyrase B/HSP90-like ATPase